MRLFAWAGNRRSLVGAILFIAPAPVPGVHADTITLNGGSFVQAGVSDEGTADEQNQVTYVNSLPGAGTAMAITNNGASADSAVLVLGSSEFSTSLTQARGGTGGSVADTRSTVYFTAPASMPYTYTTGGGYVASGYAVELIELSDITNYQVLYKKVEDAYYDYPNSGTYVNPTFVFTGSDTTDDNSTLSNGYAPYTDESISGHSTAALKAGDEYAFYVEAKTVAFPYTDLGGTGQGSFNITFAPADTPAAAPLPSSARTEFVLLALLSVYPVRRTLRCWIPALPLFGLGSATRACDYRSAASGEIAIANPIAITPQH